MKNKKLFAILTLVCFMFTLMPVAAFAAPADAETSSFTAVDGDQTVKLNKAQTEGVKFVLDLYDANENAATSSSVFVWAVNAAGSVTSALQVPAGAATQIDNVYAIDAAGLDNEVVLKFVRSGEFTVYAAIADATADSAADLTKFSCEASKITVKASNADPDLYTAVFKGEEVAANGEFAAVLSVVPNNVMSDKIYVNFKDADGKALKGATVAIETNSSSIEVNKASDVTNAQGEIDFKVAGSVEGNYEIILTVDGVEWVINVTVGNTVSAYITTVNQPAGPQALYESLDDDVIEFQITDINGNEVKAFDAGMIGIAAEDGKYLVLTEAPADSDIESEDLALRYNGTNWYLVAPSMDAEGTYAVKVILDNGANATATWTVKKFQKPVQLIIGTSTNVIELGGAVNGELIYVDANGVQKAAKDADIAVTGYAVADVAKYAGTNNFKIEVKDDEKYVGAVVTATAVSEKYDLVATKEFKVADGAVAIAFVDKTAEVNVNNKLEWNVVNSEGTRVALVDALNTSIKYVVLDAPEGAKVSVNNINTGSDLLNKGIGKMSLTSNKVGNVAVQVVMKAEFAATNNEVANQVKYYTGTQIFAVGTAGVGDVVVMSVGSNEIVINDKTATIDAAPIVENSRTFVPFRALAEAFGATVAYDEATQAVTAELNGVTVVMTIGSAEYTVNGVAKTADVAPFINGSRTMVPVRFAAEAFGIKVIPTYDENGATADILFNL